MIYCLKSTTNCTDNTLRLRGRQRATSASRTPEGSAETETGDIKRSFVAGQEGPAGGAANGNSLVGGAAAEGGAVGGLRLRGVSLAGRLASLQLALAHLAPAALPRRIWMLCLLLEVFVDGSVFRSSGDDLGGGVVDLPLESGLPERRATFLTDIFSTNTERRKL